MGVTTTTSPPATPHPAPCLYECSVVHHRTSPQEHQFQYRLFMLALDLDHIPSLGFAFPWFRHNRPGLYAFYDQDHLPLPTPTDLPAPPATTPTTKQSLTRWLAQNGVQLPPDARVLLLTLPRMLGYVFNPVSFYFCSSSLGAPICAVAEVGNTFAERKLYLLPPSCLAPTQDRYQHSQPKHFYVSPFFDLTTCFSFNLMIPGEHLHLRIDDLTDGKRVLSTALTGRRLPFTAASFGWQTFKCPLVTLKVIGLIHWNALRLWLKRIPWHAKASLPELQTNVLNPHASLRPPVPHAPRSSKATP